MHDIAIGRHGPVSKPDHYKISCCRSRPEAHQRWIPETERNTHCILSITWWKGLTGC